MTTDQQEPEERGDARSLRQWARLFQVHPRTLWRHITGLKNPSFTTAFNPTVTLEEMNSTFFIPVSTLRSIMTRQSAVLTSKNACEVLDMSMSQFRGRKYTAIISCHKFQRWLRQELVEEHSRRFL